jgi:hypothetical protein
VLKIVYEKDKDDLIPSKYMQQGWPGVFF